MFKKGYTPWNKGKKMSHEHKAKKVAGLKRYYANLSEEGRKRRSESGRRALANNPVLVNKLIEMAKTRRGEKHPNWKGGHNQSLMTAIRQTSEYKQLRNYVFEFDKYTCQKCGDKTRKGHRIKIEMHHIDSLAGLIRQFNIGSLKDAFKSKNIWDFGNLITLCQNCHRETKNFGGKTTLNLHGAIAKNLSPK